MNVLTTTYYLAVKNISSLESLFPDFLTYILVIASIGIPLTIGIGYLHFKRSAAFSSEADIQVEANPYYYKLAPGYWREAFGPTYLETLRLCMKIARNEKVNDDDLERFKELEKKMERLVKGESIGRS